MQANMQKAQAEIALMEVTGESGGGMVRITITGKHEVKRVQIEPGAAGEDRELLEDLVAAAMNDAVQKAEAATQAKMAEPDGRPAAAAGLQAAVLRIGASVKHAPALADLIDALRALPGVGPKSAQRMAFHLLQDARPAAQDAGHQPDDARWTKVGHCQRCRMLTDAPLCDICANPQRDASQICVVESPADVMAVEQSGGYRGRYFVLMGHLSPLDGIGPGRTRRARVRGAAGGGRRAGSDPRDQFRRWRARRRRTCSRSWCAVTASAPAASRMACRWAGNSNTSTAARWRMRWPVARRPLTAARPASAAAASRCAGCNRRAAGAVAGSSRSAAPTSRRCPRPRAPRNPVRRSGGSRRSGTSRPADAISTKPSVRGSSRSSAGAKSRTPGESSSSPPPGSACSEVAVVVWRPSLSRISSPMRASLSGTSARSSDDLPTPDWPTSNAVWPRSRARSASSPSPMRVEQRSSVVAGARVGGQLGRHGRRHRQVRLVQQQHCRVPARWLRRPDSGRRRTGRVAAAARSRRPAGRRWRRSARCAAGRCCGGVALRRGRALQHVPGIVLLVAATRHAVAAHDLRVAAEHARGVGRAVRHRRSTGAGRGPRPRVLPAVAAACDRGAAHPAIMPEHEQ